jgi:hypothetical protein
MTVCPHPLHFINDFASDNKDREPRVNSISRAFGSDLSDMRRALACEFDNSRIRDHRFGLQAAFK